MSYDNPQCIRQQMVRHGVTAIRQEKKARKGPEPAHTQSSNILSNPSGQNIDVETHLIHDEGDEALVVWVTQRTTTELDQISLMLNSLASQSKIAEENTRNAPEARSETRLKRVPRIGKAKSKTAGQVKEVGGGSIEYFDESARSWRPAVRHDDIRGALIEQASQIGEYGASCSTILCFVFY